MLKETVRKLHGFYYHSYQHSKDMSRRHQGVPLAADGMASNTAAVAATGASQPFHVVHVVVF